MENLTAGKFYFGRNFVDFFEVFLDRSSFLYQSPAPVIILLWGFTCLLRKKSHVAGSPLGWLGLGFSLVTVFMMSSLSTFLWNVLPFLRYTAFPWRFLLLFSFFMSWVVAYIAEQFLPRRDWWVLGAIAGSVLLLGVLNYAQYMNFKTFEATVITPEKILYGKLSATTANEYLPRVAENTAPGRSERRGALEAARAGNPANPTRYQQCQFFPEKASFEFALLNFPYWTVTVDGALQSSPSNAATLRVEVPAGRHCIEARLGYLNLQVVGFIISACSIALFVAYLLQWPTRRFIAP